MSEQQAILHHAEEHGAGQPLTGDEVRSTYTAAILAGIGTGAVALVAVIGYLMNEKIGSRATFLILSPFIGFFIGAGVVLRKGLPEILDGRRSSREATSYSPPLPEPPKPQPSPWHPPIPITSGDFRGMISMEEPPQLPGDTILPKAERLELTPDLVAEVLMTVIESGKDWSRRAVMSVRWGSRRVPKRLYNELTKDLYQSGLLIDRPTGGYRLITRDVEKLAQILPGLAGRLGRTPGRPVTGGVSDGQDTERGLATLAERRRQRWIECDCDARLYLKGGER